MNEIVETVLRAQLIANAHNKPQFVGSYEVGTETHYYIAEMVTRGCGGTWIKPSNSVIERAAARRRYEAEYTIPNDSK